MLPNLSMVLRILSFLKGSEFSVYLFVGWAPTRKVNIHLTAPSDRIVLIRMSHGEGFWEVSLLTQLSNPIPFEMILVAGKALKDPPLGPTIAEFRIQL